VIQHRFTSKMKASWPLPVFCQSTSDADSPRLPCSPDAQGPTQSKAQSVACSATHTRPLPTYRFPGGPLPELCFREATPLTPTGNPPHSDCHIPAGILLTYVVRMRIGSWMFSDVAEKHAAAVCKKNDVTGLDQIGWTTELCDEEVHLENTVGMGCRTKARFQLDAVLLAEACFLHFQQYASGLPGRSSKSNKASSPEINWNSIDSCLCFRIDDVAEAHVIREIRSSS